MNMPAQNDQPEHRVGRSVSINEAAAILGVSRRTIYNRIRDGRLQTIRTLGGSQRVLVESLPADDRPSSIVPFEHPGARVARRSVS
jgi:excisionase family DNA binding protein